MGQLKNLGWYLNPQYPQTLHSVQGDKRGVYFQENIMTGFMGKVYSIEVQIL